MWGNEGTKGFRLSNQLLLDGRHTVSGGIGLIPLGFHRQATTRCIQPFGWGLRVKALGEDLRRESCSVILSFLVLNSRGEH